jgi:hypothetical protein
MSLRRGAAATIPVCRLSLQTEGAGHVQQGASLRQETTGLRFAKPVMDQVSTHATASGRLVGLNLAVEADQLHVKRAELRPSGHDPQLKGLADNG